MEFYFSLHGRLRRRDFWLRWRLPMLPIDLAFLAWFIAAEGEGAALYGTVVYSLVTLWPRLCMIIRRLHDHSWSGWLVVLYFIPVVGAVFSVIGWLMVWFFVGQPRRNKYGPDPRAPEPTPRPRLDAM